VTAPFSPLRLFCSSTKWQVDERPWRRSFNLFSVELADPSGFFQKKSAEVFWCHDIQQSDTQQNDTKQNDVQKIIITIAMLSKMTTAKQH
jgi:hypothetical protein